MREIKFRSWNNKDKWMEDFFWVSSAGMTFDSASQTYDTPNTEIEESSNLIVMQCTGIKDKNGVEIYEGDIVEVFGDVCNVYWSESNACFHFQKQIGDYLIERIGQYSSPAYKVIGNIYENPELLKAPN